MCDFAFNISKVVTVVLAIMSFCIFTASLMLDDVCEEEGVLDPLIDGIISLRSECIIDLIEQLPCP